jgi:hypothetical protein
MATPPSDYDRALARVEQIRSFYMHALIYVVVNAGLAAFNLVPRPPTSGSSGRCSAGASGFSRTA